MVRISRVPRDGVQLERLRTANRQRRSARGRIEAHRRDEERVECRKPREQIEGDADVEVELRALRPAEGVRELEIFDVAAEVGMCVQEGVELAQLVEVFE